MKRLGQHFLKNPSITKKMVAAIAIAPGETVIEIGPGHGELTRPLVDAVQKTGDSNGMVVAIERDQSLLPDLETLVAGASAKAARPILKIMEGDALKLLSKTIEDITADSDAGGRSKGDYKVTGNIPYYITGHLLRVISELPSKPAITVLMVQKEVALRACAVAPEMNRLAASVQFWADTKVIATVPKEDFSPMPKVDSAVIMLSRKNPALAIDSEHYYGAVRGIFSQPRKTILNNISSGAAAKDKEGIALRIKECGIDPESRPQNLSVEDISSLAKIFYAKS